MIGLSCPTCGSSGSPDSRSVRAAASRSSPHQVADTARIAVVGIQLRRPFHEKAELPPQGDQLFDALLDLLAPNGEHLEDVVARRLPVIAQRQDLADLRQPEAHRLRRSDEGEAIEGLPVIDPVSSRRPRCHREHTERFVVSNRLRRDARQGGEFADAHGLTFPSGGMFMLAEKTPAGNRGGTMTTSLVEASMRACVAACLACVTACEACAYKCCLQHGELADCSRLCLDCAAVCSLCVTMMSRGSQFSRAVCELCATACSACAAECARHDDPFCLECAETCRRCAEACQSMLAA